jgi:bidirectional [NiFe] hydrogenase diaphorase subunit
MTPEELEQIAETERAAQSHFTQVINVCVAAGCLSCESQAVKDSLDQEVAKRGKKDCCRVKGVGCMGLCSEGPLVSTSNGVLYKKVTSADGAAIVESLDGEPVKELVCATDVPFFQRQTKIVLENSGNIDPDRIEDYIAANGYSALIKALTEMSPREVIDEVTKSGLRGRGGAGYPTGLKWSTVAKSVGAQKYVICNADEGDPGAFMDRSVLESDPHRVLEGMLVAGYAVGASEAYIYVRAEYPLAIKRLRNAIRQAERVGLLGANICGTRFSFRIDVRLGAGAFVCGEETALIASVEGKRGTPRPRPPYPAMEGLFGQPTLINNVETYANIAPIIRNGGAWYAAIGTEKSKGTKVFALAGRVENTGLVEVPMGISLREMVFEIGGGIPDGRKFKAVQTGGPSGGCLPSECLDMPVDYESLAKAGSIMGSGGMIVMDESSCMVDVAK